MDTPNAVETVLTLSMGNTSPVAQSETRVGRVAGTPNIATRRVREAIAQLAEQGAERVWEWLESVPDPAKRVDLYLRAIEYHVPKLARTEVTGADGGPQQHTYRWLDERDEVVIEGSATQF